jgi:hypothetical protein
LENDNKEGDINIDDIGLSPEEQKDFLENMERLNNNQEPIMGVNNKIIEI